MKTCLAIVGGVGCLSIIIIIVVLAFFIAQAAYLEPGASAYIDRAVPAIVAHWDVQQLLNRATPALQQRVLRHRGKVNRLFMMFRELGHLKHLGSPTDYKIFTQNNVTTATFTVPAKFAKGAATVEIQLLRTGKTWEINSFHITSNVFLPLAPPKPAERRIHPPPSVFRPVAPGYNRAAAAPARANHILVLTGGGR